MPTAREITALNELQLAVEVLTKAYEVSGGAENRRDQLKNYMTSVYNAVCDLGELSGADAMVMQYDHPTVMQSFDDAFLDAVEAEEASEPRINPAREWGTYSTMNGSVA